MKRRNKKRTNPLKRKYFFNGLYEKNCQKRLLLINKKRKRKRQKMLYYKRNIPKIKYKQCLICMDDIPVNEIINVHLDHFVMCNACLTTQSDILIKNKDLSCFLRKKSTFFAL